MSKKGFGSFVLGGLAGAGLALLFAPKKGEELRKDLNDKINELILEVKNLDQEEVKENINNKIKDLQNELKDLDKEKVKAIAKKQAKEIKNKADDLVDYAKEKATPVIEKGTEKVRLEAIRVTREVLAKLENED